MKNLKEELLEDELLTLEGEEAEFKITGIDTSKLVEICLSSGESLSEDERLLISELLYRGWIRGTCSNDYVKVQKGHRLGKS